MNFDLAELEKKAENNIPIELPNFYNENVEFGIPIKNKGLGVVSKNDLKCGSLILFEHALACELPLTDDALDNQTSNQNESELEAKLVDKIVQQCQNDSSFKECVFELYCGDFQPAESSSDEEEQLKNRVRKVLQFNCFGLEKEGIGAANISNSERDDFDARHPAGAGLFYKASRFNHNCFSNCAWLVVGDVMIVRALRDVRRGEELTIRYHPSVDTYLRTLRKSKHFGFECDCERCKFFKNNPKLAEIENNLRNKFEMLQNQLELRNPAPSPAKSLAVADFIEACSALLPTVEHEQKQLPKETLLYGAGVESVDANDNTIQIEQRSKHVDIIDEHDVKQWTSSEEEEEEEEEEDNNNDNNNNNELNFENNSKSNNNNNHVHDVNQWDDDDDDDKSTPTISNFQIRTAVLWLPLTCLAMLEHNAKHFELSADLSKQAVSLARSFFGAGSRLELEVVCNLCITLLLCRQSSEASALLLSSAKEYCVRHGVNMSYFSHAFQRYLSKITAFQRMLGDREKIVDLLVD